MASKNVQTAREGFEAFNRGDLVAAVTSYAAQIEMIDHPRGLTVKTPDEVKDWLDEWRTGFPDAHVTIDNIVDAGDTVVTQMTFTGTNTGKLGPVAATGKRVSMQGCNVLRFNAQGRIVKDEMYYDQLSMLVQLGLAEPPM